MSNHMDVSHLARLRAIPASTESFKLLADSYRIGALILNSSNKDLYICFADKATTEEYTAVLYPGSLFEIPPSYRGPVSGMCLSGTTLKGDVQVTEW